MGEYRSDFRERRDRDRRPPRERKPFTDGLQVEVWNGDVEKAMKILKKHMAREGIFREVKNRQAYEKPSIKKRRKSAEARKRARKAVLPRTAKKAS